MHGLSKTMRRALGALCVAAALLGGGRQAQAAPADGFPGLRDAVDALIAQIGAPETKAERALVAKLEKARTLLQTSPETVTAAIASFAAALAKLPASAREDAAVAGAITAAIAGFRADLGAAVEALAGQIEAIGSDAGPVAAALRAVESARAKLELAGNPDLPDTKKLLALRDAAKKAGIADAKFDRFIASALGSCSTPRDVFSPKSGGVVLTIEGDGTHILTRVGPGTGYGTDAIGTFSGSLENDDVSFSANWNTIELVPHSQPMDGTQLYPFVTVVTRNGSYTDAAGTLEVRGLSLRRYTATAETGKPQHFLRIEGTFTGTVTNDRAPFDTLRVTAEFRWCAIPYYVR